MPAQPIAIQCPGRVIRCISRGARRPAGLIHRHLRFVLNQTEYDEAAAIVRDEPAGPEKRTKLDRLARGSLTIEISNWELRERIERPLGTLEGLEWIEFEGRACKPTLQ